ncbi:MAG: hypothetical protein QM731_24975 [Chitinophagaceae bacterium]
MKGIYFNIGLLVFLSSFASAQTNYNLATLLRNNKLLTTPSSETHELKGDKPGAISTTNTIWFKDITFSEGVIDIDLRGRDEFLKSFLGIAFHGADTTHCDILYFRPFNFRHTDTSRHYWSVQYVSLPENSWPRLRKEHPLVYENKVNPVPGPNDWFHATLIISDGMLKVYVNHAARPSLEVRLLNERKGTMLGLYSDGLASGFANLSIKPLPPKKTTTVRYNLPQLLQQQQLEYSGSGLAKMTDSAAGKVIAANGLVVLKDVSFSDGIIEVDMKGKDSSQLSFLGIAFHVKDTIEYEVVYCRPFNFRSPDSVRKWHAVQYIHMPYYPWNRLRQQFPDAYESSVIPAPEATEWVHLKVVIKDLWISVYINHSEIPSLQVQSLNITQTGKVGIWTDPYIGPEQFANFSITR